MGVEFELKYQATGEQLSWLRDRISGQEKTFSMETTYYDTESGTLSARKYTLRRRLENGVSVCTVKAPVPGKGRGEWETVCDRIEDAIPVLCKLGGPEDLPSLTAGGVIPVCGAAFTRIAKIIETGEFTAELALDQGKLFGGGREIPLMEVELEFQSGDGEAMERYGAKLAAMLGLRPEKHSKFRRALALYRGE